MSLSCRGRERHSRRADVPGGVCPNTGGLESTTKFAPHAERVRKNRDRASRRHEPIAAFPAKAGIHPPAGTAHQSNCNDLPTDEAFVQPTGGPRLPPGKREAERERNSFTSSEEACAARRLEAPTGGRAVRCDKLGSAGCSR